MKTYNYLKQIMCLFTLFYIIHSGNTWLFPNVYPRLKLCEKILVTSETPLIITPYLRAGLISLAQNKSRVSVTDKIGVISYAGFFTVEPKFKSNLYFWYFPPFSKDQSAPVILWLQGGPGGSSLFGLFTEIGPLIAKTNGFALRENHWALHYHVIFIDNPVGTGFSFTDKGYCSNQDCIAKGLHNALIQFFELFPELKENPFFITGESYAGKYLPSLGKRIHHENRDTIAPINLKGIAMGNPYFDPIHQLDYGNYLFQHGMIDKNQRKIFLKHQAEIANHIMKQNWEQANVIIDRLMNGELTNFSYFKECTGYQYYYNFLQRQGFLDLSFINLLHQDDIRSSIHVGGLPFNDGVTVQLHLAYDIMKSVASTVEYLLAFYPIMIYSGQLDIIVAYPLTDNAINHLNFSGVEDYRIAPRKLWYVKDSLAGYWKKGAKLTNVLVRNAGHMVPHDQPVWSLNSINRFINESLDPSLIELLLKDCTV